MATHEVVIAGFGGQGVLTVGQILAYAGLAEGRHVSWYPSYGPEQRGGTANAAVVISDEPVASPLVAEPTAAIVMNLPSLEKFEPLVRPGGVLVINTSLAARAPRRRDIKLVPVPATETALALGSPLVANMVALGALLANLPVVAPDSVMAAVAHALGPAKADRLPLNRVALTKGLDLGRAVAPPQTVRAG